MYKEAAFACEMGELASETGVGGISMIKEGALALENGVFAFERGFLLRITAAANAGCAQRCEDPRPARQPARENGAG